MAKIADNSDGINWNGVIARCLAYLCLKNSKYADAQLLQQAEFLEGLGLPVADRAHVLGTTRESLGALARQAKNKKKRAKNNGKSKRRR